MTDNKNNNHWIISVVILFFVATFQVRAAEPDALMCGFDNVEDLIAIPGSEWIIGSGIGDAFFQRGGLHLFNTRTMTGRKVLFNTHGQSPEAPYDECPSPVDPDKFSAHVIALHTMPGQQPTLYVVNHGGREAIEVFRLAMGNYGPELTWKDCILSPQKSIANAIAVQTDGSLVLSASYAGDIDVPPMYVIAEQGVTMDPAAMSKAAEQMKFGALFT